MESDSSKSTVAGGPAQTGNRVPDRLQPFASTREVADSVRARNTPAILKTIVIRTAIAAIVSCVTLFTLQSTEVFAQRERAANHTIAQLNECLELITDAETGQRGFLLTQDPLYIDRYQISLHALKVAVRNLRTHFTEKDFIAQEQAARLEHLLLLQASKVSELGAAFVAASWRAGGGDTDVMGVSALALTAFASGRGEANAIESGFDAHLAKPVDISRLTEIVTWLAKQNGSGGRGKSRTGSLA